MKRGILAYLDGYRDTDTAINQGRSHYAVMDRYKKYIFFFTKYQY